MSNKLKIPQRQQGQDDKQYVEAVRQSIREQRPYLNDEEVAGLASINIDQVAPKPTATQPKPTLREFALSQKQKENLRNIQYPSNVGLTQDTYDPKVVAQEKRKLELPLMEDPNRAAATIGMIEKFMPTPKPKDEGLGLTPIDLGAPQQTPQKEGYVQPQVMSTGVQNQFIEPQDFKKSKSVREAYTAPKTQPQIDQFDEQAAIALPQGSPNQKKAYAAALRSNDNKVKTFQSYEIAKQVPNEVFESAINKKDILTQDRGTLISQQYGGDANEINKGIREYIDTEDFKAQVIKATNNNPAKYKEAAQMVLDQKADELAGAPTALQNKVQKFSDWAAQSGIGGEALYGTAKTITSGIKGLTDVGAMGAALLGGAVRTLKDLSENKVPNITSNVFESLEKSSRLSAKAIPQVYSEKADPITQGISDVTSTIAAIMTPMTAVKPLSIFQKARQAFSGVKGTAGLEAGAIVESMQAGKTAANTLTTDIAKVLNGKSANSIATILDNTVNNTIIMGAPTLEGQKQKYLEMGFKKQEAERRASGMTFITMLGLSLPNVLRPHEMPIVDRILEKGGLKQTAVGALKQGRNFAVDMAALGTIEKQIDKKALREAGIKEPETTFADNLQEAKARAMHDFFVGVGMNLISKGRAAQTTSQRAAIADAFEKPFEYSESVKDAIRKGKMTKEDAQKYQSFLNTLKPQYEAVKGETVTLPNGKVVPKFSPEKAVQVAIERTKIKQAKDALENELNREERFVTYETDKDGNPTEKVIYKHSNGKFYDYREPSVRKAIERLNYVLEDSGKQLAQIESGQYVRGKLISAKEMIGIAELNSLNGELKKGQREAIEANAPYEEVVIDVNQFTKQPEIAAKVKEFEAMEQLPELPTTNDPVLNEKGEVIEGRTQVAHAIVRAGGKLTFMKPAEKEKVAEMTNDAIETKIGSTEPLIEGLGETDAIAAREMQGVYDKSVSDGLTPYEALVATAKDGIERQYTPQETKDMLMRLNGADAVSEAMVDKAYNEASKVEVKETDIERKKQETEAKIKRKDLFSDGGVFANTLGGSGVNSVPTNHIEIRGIEFVEFSNPNTGIVDVIMTGTSESDFVGYYRLYENGNPTNRWSSKFENQSRNKDNFKTMISGVQSMLPKGHEYTEKTSISTDGLRVWNQQLSRDYQLQYNENGSLMTNRVAINGDAIVNELGIGVNRGAFDNISVTSKSQFESVKKALLPYLKKFGLGEKNIYWENGTVEIDLPILKNTEKPIAPQAKEVEKTTFEQEVAETAKALEGVDVTNLKIPKNEIAIYHYSSAPNLKLENKNTWFTESSSYPLRGSQSKVEVFINPKELKLATEKDVFKAGNGDFNKGIDVLKQNGYDGVKTKNYGSNEYLIFDISKTKNKQNVLSEAYHKAKANDSNPELVSAVEELLGANEQAPTTKERTEVNAKPLEIKGDVTSPDVSEITEWDSPEGKKKIEGEISIGDKQFYTISIDGKKSNALIPKSDLQKEIDLDKSNLQFKQESDKAREENEIKKQKEIESTKDLKGFGDKLPPMQKAKLVTALNTNSSYKGVIKKRKSAIEEFVAKGYVVSTLKNGKRILQAPDGTFFDALTKAELDYADYLITNNLIEPTKTIEEKVEETPKKEDKGELKTLSILKGKDGKMNYFVEFPNGKTKVVGQENYDKLLEEYKTSPQPTPSPKEVVSSRVLEKPMGAEKEVEQAKKDYDKLLELHNKKLESKSESRKEAAQEEAKKLTEGKPNTQVLSENFKTILLKLKELGEIDVRNIEDC